MGSNSSKPAAPPSTQSWTSEQPVRFSQELIDSLQASTENDSTRAKTLELHIQSRVQAELAALEARATKDFEELQTQLSARDDTPKGDKSASDTLRDLGRESVQSELDGLKKKLESRKQAKEEDVDVKKAKEDVVSCLRMNDRRPLDCWKEVQRFREEVRKLEGKWVEGVVR
ncbi:putative altered inheritance of mitochondria protein 13, mitochondrial [Calycina marina]|uniref:Altered inheritance of mitochondria protein 13, mitochondrial n=1 Tax=Calycina marina TaxID=1763456 RepID=A0A9P7Z585_9HELO|nr:putative altered inheritance of mitochondria protein 13, mitochondrial [Calycina marina]